MDKSWNSKDQLARSGTIPAEIVLDPTIDVDIPVFVETLGEDVLDKIGLTNLSGAPHHEWFATVPVHPIDKVLEVSSVQHHHLVRKSESGYISFR